MATPPDDAFRLEPEEPGPVPVGARSEVGEPGGSEATPAARDPAQLEFWGPDTPPEARTPAGFARRAGPLLGFVFVALALGIAIPGSPLRQLILPGVGPTDEGTALPGSLPGMSPAPPAGGSSAGDVLILRESRIEVTLEGALAGTPIVLTIAAGEGVELRLPAGSRTRGTAGRLDVSLASLAPEPVRIRIPAGDVTLLLRSGLRYLALWEGGSFQFGEGLRVETHSDGVTVLVP
jgi:hypothetical protein